MAAEEVVGAYAAALFIRSEAEIRRPVVLLSGERTNVYGECMGAWTGERGWARAERLAGWPGCTGPDCGVARAHASGTDTSCRACCRVPTAGVLEKHFRETALPPSERFWRAVRGQWSPPLETWRPRVNGVQLKVGGRGGRPGAACRRRAARMHACVQHGQPCTPLHLTTHHPQVLSGARLPESEEEWSALRAALASVRQHLRRWERMEGVGRGAGGGRG